jgi:HSP20 family protein
MAEQAATAAQKRTEPVAPKLVRAETAFNRMDRLFDAISRRAYEIFEQNGGVFGHDLDDWFKAESEILHPVHMDVSESENAIEVKAEVPGFQEKDLEINLDGRRLIISGKRERTQEQKKGKTVYSEKCSDEILRVVDLPAPVDAAKATATLKNGVLELVVPKSAKAQPVRVEAKGH